MSPMSYDVGARVPGAAATFTVAGLALALVAYVMQPVYGLVAGGVGLLLAVAAWLVRRPKAEVLARAGIGLVVGAALGYVLTTMGIFGRLPAAG